MYCNSATETGNKDKVSFMKKLEYIVVQLLALAGLEFGLFYALGWYWSCFEWSPLGYEPCGLEGLL